MASAGSEVASAIHRIYMQLDNFLHRMSHYIYMFFYMQIRRPSRAATERTSHEQRRHSTSTPPSDEGDHGAASEAARPIGYWLRAVDRLISREFADAFADAGIDRRDWMLLGALSGEVELPAFAERFARKGKRLRGLAERGWVEEQGDGTWTLTDEGRAARERLGAAVDGIRSRIAGAVSPEDYATTLASLEAMARELGWEEGQRMPRGGFGRGFGSGRGFGRGFGPGFGPASVPGSGRASVPGSGRARTRGTPITTARTTSTTRLSPRAPRAPRPPLRRTPRTRRGPCGGARVRARLRGGVRARALGRRRLTRLGQRGTIRRRIVPLSAFRW